MYEVSLYNSLTKKKERFVPLTPGKIGMYVCGVTVYDRCHLGHARAVVFFDVVYRYFSALGYEVTFVRNFTDVDDKIIERAHQQNISWNELAEKYIHKFYEDFDRLNVKKPSFEPKATEHIECIITSIEKMIARGFAYEKDGDVFFSVRSLDEYGMLSGRTVDDLLSGIRIEINDKKNDPLDFALWKKSKLNEPAWDSPWGKGRPGWHIECTAMIHKILGDEFDIHGGGNDLIFPHHENELAQARAISGCHYARYWMHNGLVTLNKEKMSKSTKNFFALEDIYNQFEPRYIRYFLLTKHYHAPLDFTSELVGDAVNAWKRVENSCGIVHNILSRNTYSLIENINHEMLKGFCEALSDDFNTPKALAILFDTVSCMNQAVREGKSHKELSVLLSALETMASILGIELFLPEQAQVSFSDIEDIDEQKIIEQGISCLHINKFSDEQIKLLVRLRLLYRMKKDFKQADTIRDVLQQAGYTLRDTKNQTIYFQL
ncbi:MAG: cysteine--tRNA ligase [bacterium]|nr:cysteine--tRNA ligase [bacterium]